MDIIGYKIGRLTVIRFIGVEKAQHKDRIRNKYMYECMCECGQTSKVNKSNLMSKSTLSCGCLQKERSLIGHQKQKGVSRPHMQKPNGESVLHSSFLTYKNGAKKRSLSFEINEDEFADLTSQNCNYCGSEPKDVKLKKDSFSVRKMNGVDRLDSNIGYTLSNSVPCCKICNYMKQDLTVDQFYSHLKRIIDFRSTKDED